MIYMIHQPLLFICTICTPNVTEKIDILQHIIQQLWKHKRNANLLKNILIK